MKIQNIHAHFDDFEFTAAGTFELWRRLALPSFEAQIVVCTDGAAGHHFRSREETAKVRLEEQKASVKIGKLGLNALRYPDGSPLREACMVPSAILYAALWKVIRDFKPDYLFCPPIPHNPLSGVHIDHLTIAESLRRVAYLINVPHAFTPEFPADESQSEFVRVPVILNPYDGYMLGGNGFDFAVNINDTFETVAKMLWCHQSQMIEWIPWVNGRPDHVPTDFDDWKRILLNQMIRRNRDVGIKTDDLYEVFTLTGWGTCPSLDQLLEDFPEIDRKVSRLDQLKKKITTLKG